MAATTASQPRRPATKCSGRRTSRRNHSTSRWNGASGRLVAQERLPDAQHVAEDAQRHPAIGLALVLDQEVEVQRLAGVAARGAEQQIGVALSERLVNEAAGDALELIERDRVDDRRRQHAAQLAGGVDRVAEAELEEAVVVAHRGPGYRPGAGAVAPGTPSVGGAW